MHFHPNTHIITCLAASIPLGNLAVVSITKNRVQYAALSARVCWFSIICLPAPKAADINCLWSWKHSTFSFCINNYMLILDRKRETLNAGLVKTCLPASLLSLICGFYCLENWRIQVLCTEYPRKISQRSRTKLRKNWGEADNFGAVSQHSSSWPNSSLLSKWKFCVFSTTTTSSSWLHIPSTYFLWLLEVSRSENQPTHQITTLDLFSRSPRSYLSRHKEVGLLLGRRKRARRVDLPAQPQPDILHTDLLMNSQSKQI